MEANSLLSKAQVYLRSASVLLELEDLDSCASRAYFSMLYAAQALLEMDGVEVPSRRGIRSSFRQVFVDTDRLPAHLADTLDQGSEIQETADYGPGFSTTEGEAEALLQQAEVLVTTAHRFADRLRRAAQ